VGVNRRVQVRKRGQWWEVSEFNGHSWVLVYQFSTFRQAMREVTGQVPYDRETIPHPHPGPMR